MCMWYCDPPAHKHAFRHNEEPNESEPVMKQQRWFHDFGPNHLLEESHIPEALLIRLAQSEAITHYLLQMVTNGG